MFVISTTAIDLIVEGNELPVLLPLLIAIVDSMAIVTGRAIAYIIQSIKLCGALFPDSLPSLVFIHSNALSLRLYLTHFSPHSLNFRDHTFIYKPSVLKTIPPVRVL